MNDDSPSQFRAIMGAAFIFVALVVAFCAMGEIMKSLSEGLLYIPTKLGMLQRVTEDEVIDLRTVSRVRTINVPQAGPYAVFSFELVATSLDFAGNQLVPALEVEQESTKQPLKVEIVRRGLRPYDTPYAVGRPVFTFVAPTAGTYVLKPHKNLGKLMLVPDYTSGHEAMIWGWYLIDAAAIVLGNWALYRFRHRAARRRQQQISGRHAARKDQFDALIRREVDKGKQADQENQR